MFSAQIVNVALAAAMQVMFDSLPIPTCHMVVGFLSADCMRSMSSDRYCKYGCLKENTHLNDR